MKSYKLILCLAAFIAVQAFTTTTFDTRNMRLLQRRVNIQSQLARHISKPLFLHVDNLHPHRDSLVRLEDPIPIDHDAYWTRCLLYQVYIHLLSIFFFLCFGQQLPRTNKRVPYSPISKS